MVRWIVYLYILMYICNASLNALRFCAPTMAGTREHTDKFMIHHTCRTLPLPTPIHGVIVECRRKKNWNKKKTSINNTFPFGFSSFRFAGFLWCYCCYSAGTCTANSFSNHRNIRRIDKKPHKKFQRKWKRRKNQPRNSSTSTTDNSINFDFFLFFF